MDRNELESLLKRVASGALSVDAALERVAGLGTADLGFAKIDHHRGVRRGMPEIVFGESKTRNQLIKIVEHHVERDEILLVSRVSEEVGRELATLFPDGTHDPLSRTFRRYPADVERAPGQPGLLVISAGTADIPVAEEVAITAEILGLAPERVFDVGVAGVHRLLEQSPRLRAARVITVVAGMEGALPSVVAGLVACPVIGVPTSIGYGVARGGKAALYGMLASCAGGLTVVNIDNGVGAACAAKAILHASVPL